MKRKVKLKLGGQLRSFVRWPLYLTMLLLLMNGAIFVVSWDAGILMLAFVGMYALIAGLLYAYNKPIIYSELVTFATQYGQIQKNLL